MSPFRMALLVAALLLPGSAPAPGSPFAGLVGDRFVRLQGGQFSSARIEPDVDVVAVYFGASWCGPCRAFVPELKRAYPELRDRRVEVVFVSDDAGCEAHRDYIARSRMPWLALPCGRRGSAKLRALRGAALPGLIAFDRQGRTVANSWREDGTSIPRATVRYLLR